MTDEEAPVDDDNQVDRIAVAMLTLRINTPPGEWLATADEQVYGDMYREAASFDGGEEYLVLSMMNLAWLALTNLAVQTGQSEQWWLQQFARDQVDEGDAR